MPSRRDSKVHSPLADGQIRLLRLKPANDHSAPIECSLFAISPTKSTQYETVSHTWGEPKRDKVIKVNSLDFQISRNLFELLPYLRRRWSDRVLWIDALCINQENHKERPSQVKMMGEIYKGASHVVIFLGKKWDGLNIAIEYLKLAAHQEDAHLNPTLEPHLHINGQNISTPYVERNLTKFFSAEWFFRVWTVQEFVLAERFSFQFETTKIGGSLFLKGFFALRRHISNQCCGPLFVECGERFVAAFTHTNALIHMRGLKRDRCFLRTLHDLRWRRCSKPRDRVYGMLRMDFTFPTSNIQPNDDIPIEQLFIDVALQNIQHTKTLDVFSFFSPGKKTSLNLPSFVPDWSLKPTNRFTHLLCGDRQMTLLHYNASWGSQAKFRFQFDDLQRHATANGVLINRIRTVGNACFFSDPGDLAGAISIVKQARQLARLPDRLPASFEAASQRELQFWRTMCGNMAVNYLGKDREWKLADPAVDFDSYLRWYNVVSSKENYCPSLLKNEPFQYPLVPNLSGRRFIRTNSGDVGMADAEAQPNDIVMVLAGGKVPYILREQDVGTTSSKHKRYRLIVDAYLDGIMQGEGVAGSATWMEVTLV